MKREKTKIEKIKVFFNIKTPIHVCIGFFRIGWMKLITQVYQKILSWVLY